VLRFGRLRYSGTPEDLLASLDGRVWTIALDAHAAATAANGSSGFLETGIYRLPGRMEVRGIAEEKPSGAAQPAVPNLEDAYVWLMTREEHERAVVG